MTVVIAAGATAVYIMTKSAILPRGDTITQDDIPEVEARDPEEVSEEEEDDSDMLRSYWAGSIPEGTKHELFTLSFQRSCLCLSNSLWNFR